MKKILTIIGFSILTTLLSIVSVHAQKPETPVVNSVTVNWNTGTEFVANTNPDNPAQGTWFIQFATQGLLNRTLNQQINLSIDQTVGGSPKTLCSFGPEYGMNFAIQYPSCATGNQSMPQTLNGSPVFQAGKQYHVFFTDVNGNVLSPVHLLQEIPNVSSTGSNSNGGNSENSTGTGTNSDSSNGGTNNSSNTGNSGSSGSGNASASTLFNTTQTDFFKGKGLVPDCGYNIKTLSNKNGSGRMCGLADIITLIQNIIEYIFILILPIVAIVFAYVGYLYLTSGGDVGKHKKAKEAMTNLGIGILIVLAAWLIIKTILESLGVDTGITNMFLDMNT